MLRIGYTPKRLSSLVAIFLLPTSDQVEFFDRVAGPWKRYVDDCPTLEALRQGLVGEAAQKQAENAQRWQTESWDIIHDLLKRRPRGQRRELWYAIREATRAGRVLALQGTNPAIRTARAA